MALLTAKEWSSATLDRPGKNPISSHCIIYINMYMPFLCMQGSGQVVVEYIHHNIPVRLGRRMMCVCVCVCVREGESLFNVYTCLLLLGAQVYIH